MLFQTKENTKQDNRGWMSIRADLISGLKKINRYMIQQHSLSFQILNAFNALKIANVICYTTCDSRVNRKKNRWTLRGKRVTSHVGGGGGSHVARYIVARARGDRVTALVASKRVKKYNGPKIFNRWSTRKYTKTHSGSTSSLYRIKRLTALSDTTIYF